jgi:hypothetical protein
MTADQAIEFIRAHGVVTESANGPLPSLVQAIVGEKVHGGWWAHPEGKRIFQITRAVRSCPEVLICRLVGGKITLVHERVWPALVHLAGRFRPERIARLTEQHTSTGRHRISAIPFPEWVPADVLGQAAVLTADAALAVLGSVVLGASVAT